MIGKISMRRRDALIFSAGFSLLTLISDILPAVEASNLRKRMPGADRDLGEFGRLVELFDGINVLDTMRSQRRPQKNMPGQSHQLSSQLESLESIFNRVLESEEVIEDIMYLSMSMSIEIPPITPPPTAVPTYSNTVIPVPTISPIVPSYPPITPPPTVAPTYSNAVIPVPTISPTVPSYSPLATPAPIATGAPTAAPVTLNPATSTVTVLTLQDVAGVCTGGTAGVGCGSDEPQSPGGNPNDMVNCFNVEQFGLTVPLQLQAVRFWLGESLDPPVELEVRVWEGTVSAGPTTKVLYSQSLAPDSYAKGENTASLTTAFIISGPEFCVGVASDSIDEGMRVQTASGTVVGGSFLRAPACMVEDFVSLSETNVVGDFCIEALVTP